MRIPQEKSEGKEDKFMTLISRNKTKNPLEKFHLTAIIDRINHYPDIKQVI
jgi:hypothetical protein